MERGGSSNRHGKTYPRTSSPGFLILDGDNAAASPVNPQEAPEHQQRVVNEQDRYLPIANVIRIMRSILPPHAKIADDAKETVQECVTEYNGFITSEANERCQREKRKTITAEDVLWAMRRLGFESYVKPLTVYLNRYRQLESRRTSVRGEPFVKRTIDFLEEPAPLTQVQPPHLPAGYLMGNPHGIYDPPFPMPMAGGFYGDLGLPTGGHAGGGGGSSSAAGDGGGNDGFEPYSMFK